jgi:hypothetical protein
MSSSKTYTISSNRQVVMKKETALWLVGNTKLTFYQIAHFCGISLIEVQALADGLMGNNLSPSNPIFYNYTSLEEISKCEEDKNRPLEVLRLPISDMKIKVKGATYVPIAKRKNKTSAIAWFVKNHPEVKDIEIRKLVGTTQSTIEKIRNGTHKDITEIAPKNPSSLGLCSAVELQNLVDKYRKDEVESEENEPAN